MSVLDDMVKEATETGGWHVTERQAAPSVLDQLVKERTQVSARPAPPLDQEAAKGPLYSDDEWGKRALAQIGSGMADWGLGARQLFGSAMPEDVEEKRRIDRRLMAEGGAGGALSMLGKYGPLAAWPPTRGGGAALSAVNDIAAGASTGALEPVGLGESRGRNVALGGAGGALFPALKGAARLTAGLSPADEAMIAAARRHGLTVTPANASTNAMVQAYKKLGDESIVPGMSSAGIGEANQLAFNRATAGAWGGTTDAAGRVTGATRKADQQRIGAELDRVWNNNDLPYTPDLFQKLQDMRAAADLQPAQIRDATLARINDFEDRFKPNAQGDLVMPGEVANNFQKDIFKRFGSGQGDLAYDMMNLRGHILDTFNRNIAGADAEALTKARGQYRAWKALEGAGEKNEAGVAGRTGDIRPTDLSSAVAKTYGEGPSPFGDLPQVGQRFMVDRVPQTGGSAKAALQNTAIGAGLTGLSMANPLAGAAALAGGIGASRAINSPSAMRALVSDADALGLPGLPFTARATKQLARRLGPVGALSLVNAYPATE